MWQVDDAAPLHLVHLGTRVLSFGDADGPCSGQTLWGETSALPLADSARELEFCFELREEFKQRVEATPEEYMNLPRLRCAGAYDRRGG